MYSTRQNTSLYNQPMQFPKYREVETQVIISQNISRDVSYGIKNSIKDMTKFILEGKDGKQ